MIKKTEQIDKELGVETCTKCNDKGSYMYDENHIKPCEVCCPHTGGFWLLEEHYGDKNGKWCCKMGCGYTQENEDD